MLKRLRYSTDVYSFVINIAGSINFNVTVYKNKFFIVHDVPNHELLEPENRERLIHWCRAWMIESSIYPMKLRRHPCCLLPMYYEVARLTPDNTYRFLGE
jgi:hypothetical protein